MRKGFHVRGEIQAWDEWGRRDSKGTHWEPVILEVEIPEEEEGEKIYLWRYKKKAKTLQ